MTLAERIAQRQSEPCLAVAPNGDRCTRTDPHGPEDFHRRGAHTWGFCNLPEQPAWLSNLRARELSGGPL